jgi:hypothetical protein
MSWAGWMALWHGSSKWIACRVGIYQLAWGLEIYKKNIVLVLADATYYIGRCLFMLCLSTLVTVWCMMA